MSTKIKIPIIIIIICKQEVKKAALNYQQQIAEYQFYQTNQAQTRTKLPQFLKPPAVSLMLIRAKGYRVIRITEKVTSILRP